jgi:Ala-tRNA(Pro) deacylase
MGDNPVASTAALLYTSRPVPGLPAGAPTRERRLEGVMRPRSLDEFLKKNRVPYTTFRHAPAFTAMQAAQLSHVPGHSWAKTVVCFAGDEVILAVVPAHYKVDCDKLRELAGASALRLASEPEIGKLYPDCEEGALPPFGGAYTRRVFVEKCFVGDPEMVFNAGTYTDCIRMHYGDFEDLANPTVGCFSKPRAES